jgi:predicted nucleotidyltransferase component of viral defense system
MKKSDFRKYVAYVKEQRHSSIDDYYIEKDYFLSLFLSTWQQFKEEGKVPHLDAMIFKGGTLLVRNFLQYSRISEDLDFTHANSNALRVIQNENKRENEIKKRIIPIIEEIKLICDAVGFDFDTDRTKPRYVVVRNSRAVYVLHMYYRSLITGEEIPIKIELNFLENIMHTCSESRINNIVDHDIFLKSIGYDLESITMKTYPIEEIILEKYRAVLTRDALKERDILDLYLIHQRGTDVFKADNTSILTKIESGVLIAPDLKENLEGNCRLVHDDTFGESDDDISRFTLVEIDGKKYEEFKTRLYGKLKEICKMRK